jgi:gag-polypeptide of LTR copia-type
MDRTRQAGRVALKIIQGSKTRDMNGGDSALAWQRLSDRFAPKKPRARRLLRQNFVSSKMKPKDDPDDWLTTLEDLRDQYIYAGGRMTDEEVSEQALMYLPKAYEVIVSSWRHDWGTGTIPGLFKSYVKLSI